jgi:hypothetical protein
MMSNSTEQLAFNLLLKQRAEDIDSGKVELVSGDVLEMQVQEPFSSLRGLFKGQSSLVTRDNDRI